MEHDPHLGRGVCARWWQGIPETKEGEYLPFGRFAFVRAVEQDANVMRGDTCTWSSDATRIC